MVSSVTQFNFCSSFTERSVMSFLVERGHVGPAIKLIAIAEFAVARAHPCITVGHLQVLPLERDTYAFGLK